jgi:methylenetetrahydrofolate--tRNA-(uracil-5-)-methyltransferase
MIGVEGYVESAAAGLLAALNAANLLSGRPLIVPPPTTALGSLIAYITDPGRRDFQPINANYGLMPELGTRARGKQKKIDMAVRALAAIDEFVATSALVETAAAPLLQDTP